MRDLIDVVFPHVRTWPRPPLWALRWPDPRASASWYRASPA